MRERESEKERERERKAGWFLNFRKEKSCREPMETLEAGDE
jgi:hypothetical protein